MGTGASKQRKLFRPFDAGEFTVAWLTFKGDAVEDEEQRYVAKKEGLASSKLLRGLFGDLTMQCFESVPGETISKEAFICILALSYEGNTEDRISYIFRMYNIMLSGESQGESFIAEKDYLYLLNYLEEVTVLPKQLYAAFEECMIPMAGLLSNSQFVQWVRKYPDVMEFIAAELPPSSRPASPLTAIRTSEEFVSNSDPLNSSPSCRRDGGTNGLNSFSSFDFIGGEDSGDEDDSDDLYDSDDQIFGAEEYQGSYRGSAVSVDGRDELTSILKEAGAVVGDNASQPSTAYRPRPEQQLGAAPSTTLTGSTRDQIYSQEESESSTTSSRRVSGRSGGYRSRGVHKMGRHIGKAVGGGISKVGNVGRSILHVGKSQGYYNQHSVAAAPSSASGSVETHGETDPAAAVLLSAGYLFSSESQSTSNYVCGYLHKISDSKWSKRSWHRRWFVLDRQRGVLSYYRHNPANHISASPHGNIVHMVDDPVPVGEEPAVGLSDQPSDAKQPSLEPPSQQQSSPLTSSNGDDDKSSEGASGVREPVVQASDDADTSGPTSSTTLEAWVSGSEGQQSQQQASSEKQQTLLYLNEEHPWYRGSLDLNMDNVSLLFEKTLAKNAPTRYFFQVSTLALHEMDSKRGIQYKLCADSESDFDLWTAAIAESVNRKIVRNEPPSGVQPVVTHQQLYRQRLLAQEHEQEDAPGAGDVDNGVQTSSATENPSPVDSATDEDATVEQTERPPATATTSLPPAKRATVPPRIVTQFPVASCSTGSLEPSCWHLEISVDGTKQCLIVGVVLNIVAMRCLASEHVMWKLAVCIAVTCAFVASVYHPQPSRRRRGSSIGGAFVGANGAVFTDDDARSIEHALLATDISQCSDPKNCCLHKLETTGGLAQAEKDTAGVRSAMEGSRRASMSVQRLNSSPLAKFPMCSSMSKSEMETSGCSSNVAHSWAQARAETFCVRSSEYKKLRRKEASRPALFEFLGADLMRTDGKVDLISQRVDFPPEYADARLFIINAQLPSYGPSVWSDGAYDGPGYSLVLYWKIPDDVYKDLEQPTTTTLKLLKRFLEAGGDTALTDRFKVIAQVTNQDECGITGMAKKLLVSHNATPVLTRPQHRLYHFRDGSTEMVVDIHAFSYIARRGIHLLLDKTTRLVIDIAFVLQGETDEELPEQVLGCCRLDHIDVQQAQTLP